MQLSPLLTSLRARAEYQAALGSDAPLGLSRAARAPVIAAFAEDRPDPVLVVCARHDRALTLTEEIGYWSATRRVLQFAEPNPLFYESEAWGPNTIRARLEVLSALAQHYPLLSAPAVGPAPIVVASARALMTRTLPRRDFLTQTRPLKTRQTIRLEKLLAHWVALGYTAESMVIAPGQFSRRGGILDIFPMTAEAPVRLELFGDEIDTLRYFDPATQRSGDKAESLSITPASEGGNSAFSPHAASLLEYLPESALLLVEDWGELADTVSELEEQALALRQEQIEAGLLAEEAAPPYHGWAELQDELSQHQPLTLSANTLETTDVLSPNLGAYFQPGPRYGGQLKPLLEHLMALRDSGERAVIVTRQAQRLAELWGEQHAYSAPTESITQWPAPGELVFVQGALTEGWILKDTAEAIGDKENHNLHLLTDSEIFGWARPEPRRRHTRPTVTAPETNFADFAPNDFVVHADHGIARFMGLVRRAIEGLEREYLHLEYAEGDELYVPIHQADRITKYIGVGEQTPALSRLGSADWSATKTKAQHAVVEVAKDLLELYAQREATPGHSFGTDTTWQAELEASFPYVETEDQLRAIGEVKADMERARPMDRLICGDVGYGKTEVALRAAFKAVMDGKQVAVLVPTTVLAQQHLHTFQTRLAAYPVKVEMLSRFRSPAEARTIIEKLNEGQIDIVVGTHRLIQKDVRFKNLGLLIIDEEQRFGVTHKEFLKRKRTEVDVLTLTATPIPRTLYMSLTGVRDISTINTPPDERLPIITHTGAHQDKLVRQAILRELDRGGQIFYVHNRVQSIGVARRQLHHLVPEARLGVGHGQMDEHELSQVMDQFTTGEIDILLCTSIIESGLDIPNANTLIVDRADTFGLAQLYQLRGRVGRGAARAYAYFFTDKRYPPTPEARERLTTLAEQTELGAGYSIAMRDLEMRGAGDLLGMRQHGHIAAVGFHLYTRLLSEAVKLMKKGEKKAGRAEKRELEIELGGLEMGEAVTVDLPIPISIPAEYVSDRPLRLRLYRRLASLPTEAELDAMSAELTERFGPLPEPVKNLLYQLRVKQLARRAGVGQIAGESGQIVLALPEMSELDQAYLSSQLGATARVSKSKIWLARAGEQDWRVRLVETLVKLEAGRGTRI